jgi:hypothetical protein
MYYFLISNSHKWWWSFLFAHDCFVQSELYRVNLVQQRLLVQMMMLAHNELLRPDLCSTVEAPYSRAPFLSNLFHDGECWASISLISDLSNIMNLVADGSTELLTYSDWPLVPQVSEPSSVSCLKWTPSCSLKHTLCMMIFAMAGPIWNNQVPSIIQKRDSVKRSLNQSNGN